MKCAEFEVRLNEVLDARSAPEGDGPLAAHAQICGPCRDLMAAYQELFREVRPRAPGEVNVTALVLAELQATPQAGPSQRKVKGRARRVLAWVSVAAVAAAILVMVAWGPSWWSAGPGTAGDPTIAGGANQGTGNNTPGGPHAPGTHVAGTQHNQNTGTQNTGAQGVDEDTRDEPAMDMAEVARESYRQLAQQTSDGLSDVGLLVPAMESTPAGLAATTSLPRLAPNVAEGVKPLTRSTAGTFSMFFGVFPTSRPPAPPQSPSPPPGQTP